MPRKVKKPHFSNLKITSIISITLVLFVVGLLALLLLIGNHLTRQTKENLQVSILLTDTINDEQLSHMDNYLSIVPYVHSHTYISKDSALIEHIADLGEDPTLYLGYNPLQPSYAITLNADYATPDSLDVIETRLRSFNDIVTDVVYQRDVLSLLNHNLRTISIFFAALALVLLFIAIVLILNTIRLSIYSRRFTINTMKLVGATAFFIRRPFVWQAIGMGLIASLLAISLLAGTLFYVSQEFSLSLTPLLTVPNVASFVLSIILISIIITSLSATWAVNHYIRIKTSKLYYI